MALPQDLDEVLVSTQQPESTSIVSAFEEALEHAQLVPGEISGVCSLTLKLHGMQGDHDDSKQHLHEVFPTRCDGGKFVFGVYT